MKKYVAGLGDKTTMSSRPIKETIYNGDEPQTIDSVSIDISESDVNAIEEGSKEFEIKDGKVTLKNSTKKAEKEAAELAEQQAKEALKAEKDALKAKCEAGTATLEEIQQALTKLL